MGTRNLFFLKTHFDLLSTCFLDEFFCGKMIGVVRSLRVFLFDYLFYAFGVIVRNVLRFKEEGANNEEDIRLLKSSSGSENGGIGETSAMSYISPTTSVNKFVSVTEVDRLNEEPDSIGWIMQQFFVENYDSNDCGVQIIELPPDESSLEFASLAAEKEENLEKGGQEVLSEHGHGDSEEDEFGSENKNEIRAEGDFREADFEREAMDEKKWDYFVERLGTEEKIKPEIECKNEKDYQFFTILDMLPDIQVVGDDYSIPSDTDSDSINSNDEGVAKSNHEEIEETEETFRDRESNLGSEICYSDDDFIEFELQTNDPVPAKAENPPLEDPQKLEEDDETEKSVQELETYRQGEPSVKIYNEDDEPETAPEHEDLVEQLKRELRNVRTGGLPTIWEDGSEPESPLTIDQSLKAVKIDQKYEQKKDQIEESQKVYKAYEEKMKKLDIFNDQTMNAIGILQLKTQNDLIWGPKSSIPAFKAFISHNFWPKNSKKSVADSSLKSTGDLHKEMELVYVGQICLSWEIIYWQHRKALQLQELESKGLGRYEFNQVAADFQTFQVLMDRFVENDKFHGSRVENYVRNRSVMQKFLQVPPIKGDCLKVKNAAKNKEVINGGMLAQMIEESIRAFHEFICADKEERKQTQTDLEDEADSTLLDDTKAALQKKEKQLKEIKRSRNCIVKKLQKNKEERTKYALVVAEVELKVVGRALRMARLTKSQLHWCSQKLDQLSFFRGKLKLDPSFLLFPC